MATTIVVARGEDAVCRIELSKEAARRCGFLMAFGEGEGAAREMTVALVDRWLEVQRDDGDRVATLKEAAEWLGSTLSRIADEESGNRYVDCTFDTHSVTRLPERADVARVAIELASFLGVNHGLMRMAFDYYSVLSVLSDWDAAERELMRPLTWTPRAGDEPRPAGLARLVTDLADSVKHKNWDRARFLTENLCRCAPDPKDLAIFVGWFCLCGGGDQLVPWIDECIPKATRVLMLGGHDRVADDCHLSILLGGGGQERWEGAAKPPVEERHRRVAVALLSTMIQGLAARSVADRFRFVAGHFEDGCLGRARMLEPAMVVGAVTWDDVLAAIANGVHSEARFLIEPWLRARGFKIEGTPEQVNALCRVTPLTVGTMQAMETPEGAWLRKIFDKLSHDDLARFVRGDPDTIAFFEEHLSPETFLGEDFLRMRRGESIDMGTALTLRVDPITSTRLLPSDEFEFLGRRARVAELVPEENLSRWLVRFVGLTEAFECVRTGQPIESSDLVEMLELFRLQREPYNAVCDVGVVLGDLESFRQEPFRSPVTRAEMVRCLYAPTARDTDYPFGSSRRWATIVAHLRGDVIRNVVAACAEIVYGMSTRVVPVPITVPPGSLWTLLEEARMRHQADAHAPRAIRQVMEINNIEERVLSEAVRLVQPTRRRSRDDPDVGPEDVE